MYKLDEGEIKGYGLTVSAYLSDITDLKYPFFSNTNIRLINQQTSETK